MIPSEKVYFGGGINNLERTIEPTLLQGVEFTDKVMSEEIFGPILPVLSYKTEEDIDVVVSNYEKPLSFYIFSTKTGFTDRMLDRYSFGGGCINDTIVHYANHNLPFGGTGNSGVGSYHGKFTFDTFTHQKAITKRPYWLDLPVRYAPYKGKLKTLKFSLKYL